MSIAQIYAVLALLLAFGVPRSTVNSVQDILQKANPSVQISLPTLTPQVDTPLAASAPVPTCVANPVLTLSADHTSVPYKFDSGYHPRITGQYSTGCPLDPNTPFTFDTISYRGEMINHDFGTLQKQGEYYDEWNLRASDTSDGENPTYTSADFAGTSGGVVESTTTFVMTVGKKGNSVTATTTINIIVP